MEDDDELLNEDNERIQDSEEDGEDIMENMEK